MRHARRRVVRRLTRLAAVGGLLLGCTMVARAAVASEPPPASARSLSSAGNTGAAWVARLGTARTAGTWIGSDGRPVVAVTDDAAARAVRRTGAKAKIVRNSMNDLTSATATLRAAPRVAGTAWAVDYRTNTVKVQADRTVSAANWSRISQVAKKIGGFVHMERTKGAFTTRLNGALPILSAGGRCSAGFNVTNGSTDFILTAGHCGPAGSTWFADNQGNQQLGRTVNSVFPGHDFSLVQYSSGQAGKGADVVAIGGGKGVRITGAADPAVGQRVFRSGSTSGLHDGQVTALNATVNYPEGTVSGLIETTVCAEPGDSGGPLFSEGVALGVTSGGNGDCTTGGTTFFQPVTKAMTALGVRLIVSAQNAGGTQSGAPSPGPSTPPQRAIAPSAASPGSSAPVTGTAQGGALLARLTDARNIGPGLLVIAGSLIALVATRYIRAEQERRAYQQHYSATWG
ncbi:S1 family peptidase [Streptomyces pluripotens]|uniref:S1 family peptidase n=1 Tax=Streptomyces pluripotens TaxID=1355015 RepID=A0A221NSL9_9ACTN|nr:S1 family peptidase [Streptomyces pluripotens]ARP68738.1 serine protease [Streptomyces pluripotens]ASN22993.1 S1 family peptidase [Streptomyces pluripotens]